MTRNGVSDPLFVVLVKLRSNRHYKNRNSITCQNSVRNKSRQRRLHVNGTIEQEDLHLKKLIALKILINVKPLLRKLIRNRGPSTRYSERNGILSTVEE